MPHSESVNIVKKGKEVARVNLEIKYLRDNSYGASLPVAAQQASFATEKQPIKPQKL